MHLANTARYAWCGQANIGPPTHLSLSKASPANIHASPTRGRYSGTSHEYFMAARSKAGEWVNRRAIFCLTEHSIAGYASAAGRNIAVQSPASQPAARIHSKRGTSQIGLPILPIAHRQSPSKQPASHEIFRLGQHRSDIRVPLPTHAVKIPAADDCYG